MNRSFTDLLSVIRNCQPSKWGPGVGLLWRGNTFSVYSGAVLRSLWSRDTKENFKKNAYLFESSRVAIYHYARFLDLQAGDKVQVMGFTCDAVTDALEDIGCDVVLYDCDLAMKSNNFQLLDDVKLVVNQVSFGVAAISDEVLAQVHASGVNILLDKSLSYGQEDFDDTFEFKYPTVISFEVSKSLTLGWGGRLNYPNNEDAESFQAYYDALASVSLLDDSFRILRTLTNLFMVQRGSKLRYFFWLILRGLGFHRASVKSSGSRYKRRAGIGMFSRKIFDQTAPRVAGLLARANKNHEKMKSAIQKLGLTVISSVDKEASSPRVVFLVEPHLKVGLEESLKREQIELGFWFDTVPLKQSTKSIQTLDGTRSLMAQVVNLPCHWSLSNKEIEVQISSLKKFFIERENGV